MFTLTILGAGPAAPNPAGACSGYLARDGGANVLLDCGSGVASRIAQQLPPSELRGVVISHLHPDHYFDLVPLYYILKFEPARPAAPGPRLPVYVPPGGRDFFARFARLISDQPDMLDDVFELTEYAAGRQLTIGGFTFTFHPVQHYVSSHAMRLRGPTTAATLTFSSDAAPCPGLVEAARGVDLFMCESAILDRTQDRPDPADRGHMLASEAGAIARAAGAQRLLITHYRSGNGYDARHQEAAQAEFGGEVELAREGATYTIG